MKQKAIYKNLDTLLTHLGEFDNDQYAHIMPIYQSSTFYFPDVETGAQIAAGERPGYFYSRIKNPNFDLAVLKIAALEAWDFIQAQPEKPIAEQAGGYMLASGMAAVAAGVLAQVKAGDALLTQCSLYDGTYIFFKELLPGYGIDVVWVADQSAEGWQQAFAEHPNARMVYLETPVNPALLLTDIKMVAEIAHQHGARVMVDNTFATPWCQRPLSLGADIVIHSTTKYLNGHGNIIGGALISRDFEFLKTAVFKQVKIAGATPSPLDAWLTNLGLKTFNLRMAKHCENALKIARYLETHPAVNRVYYPGLESHPQHDLAKRQMLAYGGMIAFDLKGGVTAGENLLNRIKVITLAVSLGNLDSLIQHPASMTHRNTPRELRMAAGITDGLVRFSVGIEDADELIADLDQALGN